MYMHFAIHIADIFEGYLTLLQSSKPVEASRSHFILTKFTKSTILLDSSKIRKYAQGLGTVDMKDKKNLISFHEIDYGKATLREIGYLENDTNLDALKTEFKMCYQELTSYLQENLPYKHSFLKDSEYLHKDNRLKEEAVPAIRQIATKVELVLQGTNFTQMTGDR